MPLHAIRGPGTPTNPLPRGTGYLVLLTNGIQMANGAAATADRDYATIKTTLGPDDQPGELRHAAECAHAGRLRLHARRTCGRGESGARPAGAESREHHRVLPLHDAWRRATRCARSVSTIFNPAAPAPAIAVNAARRAFR